MFKFLKKYSLVLFLATIAGFFIGFKVFSDTKTDIPEEAFFPETEVLEPTPTFVPSPTSTPTPVFDQEELITDEEIEEILIDLGVDLDNPTEEDLQKILDFLEETGN